MRGIAPHMMVTTDAVGGVWRYSKDLACEVQSRGWRVTLVCVGPPPHEPEREALAARGVELHATPMPLDWVAAGAAEVRIAADYIAEMAQRLEADAVHLHSPAYAVSSKYRTPVVAVSHSCLASWWNTVHARPLPPEFHWRADLHREGLVAADRVLCPSAFFSHQTQALYNLDACPITVLNGCALLPAATSSQRIGVFASGRLWDEAKNMTLLDRAAPLVSDPVYVAGALVGPAGNKISFQHLRALGNLNAEAHTGFLSHKPIYVSPSLYEPFGLGVLEAAKSGCPLVLADIPTFRELWNDSAIFVDPDDHMQLAHVINHLLAKPNMRFVIGEKARDRAGAYSVEAMAAGVAEVHRGLLQHAKPRAVLA